MPPPLNPQGSRAGLITAVVVLSILFVTSAIFAFYYSAETNRANKQLADNRTLMQNFASAEAQSDPAIQAVAELRSQPENAGKSAIQILNDQKNALAAENAKLSGDVARLTTENNSLKDESQQKTDQLAEATKKLTDTVASNKEVQGKLTAAFDEQSKQLTEAMAQLASGREETAASVTKIQGSTEGAIKRVQAELSKEQKLRQDVESKLAQANSQIEILKNKVPRLEEAGVSVIRQPDARVVRVPGNDNVFINLGTGDRITPGMTFEVYDRFTGVPAPGGNNDLTDTTNDLPKGKASIEVVRLGPGQSECRIIRQTQGKPVVEGDVVSNLVYDRNTKYNFVVFGDFDLDQDGTAIPADTAVVRRLVTQWGGTLQQDVAVDTDFLVVGKEPEVPIREENESATDIRRREEAERQLDAYNALIEKARDLNVPILNQNRFLYYIGYYEQAQR